MRFAPRSGFALPLGDGSVADARRRERRADGRALGVAAGLRRGFVELVQLGFVEHELGGVDVLLEMGDRARPRDRQHHRRARKQPGERDLARGRIVRPRDLVDEAAGLRQRAGAKREPREEAQAVALADIEHIL